MSIGTNATVTVTVWVIRVPPSFSVAVITAVPVETAVITPVSLTVATPSLSEIKVTSPTLFTTVAVSASVAP
jgi:hypothetical protein